MNVTFDFWTNLCGCGGGNVGGTCTMEISEDELQVFKQANEMAEEDEAEKIIDYFEGKMPEELRERIDHAIFRAFQRQEAEDSIRCYGIDCFSNMSEEEFDDLSMEELIDRCIEDNCDGVLEFHVVEISFRQPEEL